MSKVSIIRQFYTLVPLFWLIDGCVLLLSSNNRRLGDNWAETIVINDGKNVEWKDCTIDGCENKVKLGESDAYCLEHMEEDKN